MILHILYAVLNFISRGVNMMTVPKEAPSILWEMENVALSCGFFTGRWGDNGRLATTPFADTDTARLPWKARVWWGTTLGWNLMLCLEEPWGKLIRVFWHPNCIGGRQNPFMLWYSQLVPLRKPEEKNLSCCQHNYWATRILVADVRQVQPRSILIAKSV